MKRFTIFIFIFLTVTGIASGQGRGSKKSVKPRPRTNVRSLIGFLEIKQNLGSKSKESSHTATNFLLISEIHDRGVSFVMDENKAEVLRQLGASRELLSAIDSGWPPHVLEKDWLLGIMQGVCFPQNEDDSDARSMLLAAKRYLSKFGDDPGDVEFTDYLRKELPIVEKRLDDLDKRKFSPIRN